MFIMGVITVGISLPFDTRCDVCKMQAQVQFRISDWSSKFTKLTEGWLCEKHAIVLRDDLTKRIEVIKSNK